MSVTSNAATEAQLIKSKVAQTNRILKSNEARRWLAKRQLKRTRDTTTPRGMYRLRARQYDGSAGPGELAKADGYIRTIYDLVDLHYGFMPTFFQKDRGLEKQSHMQSTTQGVANVVYGQEVYSLLNSESNVYSLLEKRPWRRSGERAVFERADDGTHNLPVTGVEENASLPDVDHPVLDEFEQSPKNIAHNFSVSQIEQLLADTEDDHFANDPMDWLRRWYGTGTEHQTGQGEHPKHINAQLCRDPSDRDANDFLSIDQAISNQEETNITGVTDSDYEIYDFDRSLGEFESNVLHNDGDNRNLTVNLLDDAITAIREASGKDPVTDDSYFFLTNHEAFQIIEEEVAAKERLEPVRVQVGLNGVQTQPGDDVGITVQSYKQIPIFRSDDVIEDGTGRIYLIDSNTMWIKQLLPTQYYDTGIDIDNNPFAINRLGNEGMFLTIGELTLVNPVAHAKIRDLA